MRWLITGGFGFIGTNLIKKLIKLIVILILTLKNMKIIDFKQS